MYVWGDMAIFMTLLRPPLPPASPHHQLTTGIGTSRWQCRYSFNSRGMLPSAPPLLSHTPSEQQTMQSDLLLPNLVAKVFGPAIFEDSKLDVMFVGVEEEEHPDDVPRIYTLTHCDITAMLTLTIAKSIQRGQLQGWYKRLQRDDVVAMWRRCQGSMSLHVHCHISGGHWFRDALARLRFHIFKRELPVVLEAFRHGDKAFLFNNPELENAPVWVYFHSNVKEFNKVECWGPLQLAAKGIMQDFCTQPAQCRIPCDCCFPK